MNTTGIEIRNFHTINLYFDWSKTGFGFGQLGVNFDRGTNTIHIDNECMTKEACKALLYAAVDKMVDSGKMDCTPPTLVLIVAPSAEVPKSTITVNPRDVVICSDEYTTLAGRRAILDEFTGYPAKIIFDTKHAFSVNTSYILPTRLEGFEEVVTV